MPTLVSKNSVSRKGGTPNDPPDLFQRNNSHVTRRWKRAVHLGCEEGFHNGLAAQWVAGSPPCGCCRVIPDSSTANFYLSVIALPPYQANVYNYDGNCDIVTNFMLSNTPTYIESYYSNLSFTKSSKYITDGAYRNLMRSDVTISMGNATWFSDNGHGEYAFTQGLRNEYNDERSPIHLIWRTRPDLMSLFPNGNKPDSITAVQVGWPASPEYDLVHWGMTAGSMHALNPEYPEWVILDNGHYAYDKNMRTIWKLRPDLQSAFPNGHSNANPTWTWGTMIDWATQYGYWEQPEHLDGYQYWPYIGTIQIGERPNSKNVSAEVRNTAIPNKLTLFDVYPNPFNPITQVKYSIPSNGQVSLIVYDMLGREVAVIENSFKLSGSYTTSFDASKLSSGVYVCRLQIGQSVAIKKMVVTK